MLSEGSQKVAACPIISSQARWSPFSAKVAKALVCGTRAASAGVAPRIVDRCVRRRSSSAASAWRSRLSAIGPNSLCRGNFDGLWRLLSAKIAARLEQQPSAASVSRWLALEAASWHAGSHPALSARPQSNPPTLAQAKTDCSDGSDPSYSAYPKVFQSHWLSTSYASLSSSQYLQLSPC